MDSNLNCKNVLFKINSQSLKKYEQCNVYFTKPRLVALYDCKYDTVTHANRIHYLRNMEYIQYPIDLNAGFESYIRNSNRLKFIECSLEYYMSLAAERDGAENLEKTKVITRQGTLTHIMNSYYNELHLFNTLTILVSRYNGNLYIVRDELNSNLKKLLPVNTHHLYLEKLLLCDSKSDTPIEENKPCDENVGLVGVHRSNFGKYDIIYSGEVQGIDSDEEITDFNDLNALNECRYVFAKQMWTYLKGSDKKLISFWLQAYLANVKDLYIGYKNKSGIIEEPIEHIKVNDIPKNRSWKPVICNGILMEFLLKVESLMADINSLHTVYVFTFNHEKKFFSYNIFKGKSDQTFISEEYMEYCKQNSRK